jgi:hypothetical protein
MAPAPPLHAQRRPSSALYPPLMRALRQLGSPGQQISSDTASAQECGSQKQAGRAGQDQGDARQCNTEGGPVSSAGFEEGARNSRLGVGAHHLGRPFLAPTEYCRRHTAG